MPDSQIDISKHQFERNNKIFLKKTISGIGWNVFRITQAVFDWEIWRGIHSSKSSQCYNWSTAFNISDWLSFGRYRCWDLLSQLISQHLNLLILISKNLIWPILTKLTKLIAVVKKTEEYQRRLRKTKCIVGTPDKRGTKKMRSSHSNNKMFSSKLKHKHKDKNQFKTARPMKLIDFETHIIPEMTVEFNIQAFNISPDES